MRLATVWCCRLSAAFLCGVALGFAAATLDFRSSSAWLQRQLQAALAGDFLQYEYEYEYEWSTLAASDIPARALPTLPAARRKPECNRTAADSLRQRVRVLCWVMTSPKNHATKAAAVNATWGQNCDKLLFMTSEDDPRLPTVALKVPEGRQHLWAKTQAAFKYIVHEGLLESIDWVLKADDDTFIVMENLRHLLLPLDASQSLFGGLRLRPFSPKGFMSGGAGYVLSRMAALRFVEQGISGDLGGCRNPGYRGEDVAIGRCMVAINATFLDSRDSDGLERFHAYGPEREMAPDKRMDWLKNYSYHPLQPGYAHPVHNRTCVQATERSTLPQCQHQDIEDQLQKLWNSLPRKASKCCSPAAVSFHYITPTAMRAIYYLVYRLKPYGLDECELPAS
ncbi:glycoprotein-N-acetylgalactosamine 3-beta-galactosyltransferase 1-like isoform X1 [Schistocerca piceifrons]|uniref:glycoprotein-N-acetylgalactosamine 3-beta-galactosyltransferase 1-like isoform X1 n=1 Tax=Schistocerca piceifrons TaxID=274613 RepID=UPI001F5ECE55|nr:glycoprotein-N-acetylgalactosamine 3-beta-galactosyltransferase 1-like isoform X1 [Schistocerca piceifrons]